MREAVSFSPSITSVLEPAETTVPIIQSRAPHAETRTRSPGESKGWAEAPVSGATTRIAASNCVQGMISVLEGDASKLTLGRQGFVKRAAGDTGYSRPAARSPAVRHSAVMRDVPRCMAPRCQLAELSAVIREIIVCQFCATESVGSRSPG